MPQIVYAIFPYSKKTVIILFGRGDYVYQLLLFYLTGCSNALPKTSSSTSKKTWK